MEENFRYELINSIISEYCSDEYKNRHDAIATELACGELSVKYDEEFDKAFLKMEEERICTKRGYFV